MKTNETPEKIYLERVLCTDVVYDNWKPQKTISDDIEYIRTDAFIKKATEWLKKNADSYTWYNEFEGESGMIDEFIEDFKEYLKK